MRKFFFFLMLMILPATAYASAVTGPAYMCISAPAGKVCADKTGTNTLSLQGSGATITKVGGKPVLTVPGGGGGGGPAAFADLTGSPTDSAALSTALGSKVPEAPLNQVPYVRINGTWVTVPTAISNGSMTAPTDTSTFGYAGSDGSWLQARWSTLKSTLQAAFNSVYHGLTVTWAEISGKPTSLVGYGITDATSKNAMTNYSSHRAAQITLLAPKASPVFTAPVTVNSSVNGAGEALVVYATNQNAIKGQSAVGQGLVGVSTGGVGVEAHSTDGQAIYAESENQTAVEGHSTNSVGAVFNGGKGAVTIGSLPANPSGVCTSGTMYYNSSTNSMKQCVAGLWGDFQGDTSALAPKDKPALVGPVTVANVSTSPMPRGAALQVTDNSTDDTGYVNGAIKGVSLVDVGVTGTSSGSAEGVRAVSVDGFGITGYSDNFIGASFGGPKGALILGELSFDPVGTCTSGTMYYATGYYTSGGGHIRMCVQDQITGVTSWKDMTPTFGTAAPKNVGTAAGDVAAANQTMYIGTTAHALNRASATETLSGVNIDGSAGSAAFASTAAAAGKLATARTINGVGFDGTTNITIADATKAPLDNPTITTGITTPLVTSNAADNTHYVQPYNSTGLVSCTKGMVQTVGTPAVLQVCTADGTWAAVTGAVATVFGRTGAVVSANGDYTVAQVTGAAPLASPTFTGTPAAPTATAGTNSTQVATTGFVANAISSLGAGTIGGSTGSTDNALLVANGTGGSTLKASGVMISPTTGALTEAKQPGVPDSLLLYNGNSTETTGFGILAPATTMATSYYLQPSATAPTAGQILIAGTPGTSTVNGVPSTVVPLTFTSGSGTSSGTYTPTGSTGVNLSSVTPYKAHWLRIGNEVSVWGTFDATSTSSTATVYLSLPTGNSSNFTDPHDCSGSGTGYMSNTGVTVQAESSGSRANLIWSGTSGAVTYKYSYTYTVK